ncbi:TY-Chap domain-containing protein [Pseudarthrobacter sp. Y6]|uniref:TY-Chap domain-containing protein n=1 Tax=Pseudarthrobacter sp. Y6 TaxID=3418422 RepID=UPI003CEDE865
MGETEDGPVADIWAFLDMPDESAAAKQAAYRNGDPLRAMAATHGSDISALCTAMAAILDQSDELERFRSVRRRSVAAAVVLRAEEQLVDRLSASGIARTDIPTILTALGSQIDAEMAIELLGIPSGPLDIPAEPRRLADKLSLLFVAGTHHGIERDHQLALGKMSLDAVAELRELLHPDVPYRRLADILAVIEPTARAIRTRRITTLAFGAYEDTARRISRELGMITRDQADPWPVPARILRRRYGRGFWEDALTTVGLALPAAESRFGRDDYFQALDDFSEECLGADYPLDIGTYDRWVVADSAMGADRPSAIEMIRHYGTWEAAVETVLPSDKQEETKPVHVEPQYIDYDSGWGTLEELNAWEAEQYEEWRAVGKALDQLIEAMPTGSFLHIQYGDTGAGIAAPYARATLGSNGVTCEIVSHVGYSPHGWCLSTNWLSDHGWTAPGPGNTNWLKAGVPRTEAADKILIPLQFGRVPLEATELRWSVGRVPDGPGPSRGVTLNDALRGVVQTLQNAELGISS